MYAFTLLGALYVSFFGMLAMVYRELPKIRAKRLNSEIESEPAFFARLENQVLFHVKSVRAGFNVGLFKGSALLHRFTSNLTSKLYRRASSGESAEVSALLRSLNETNPRNVVR